MTGSEEVKLRATAGLDPGISRSLNIPPHETKNWHDQVRITCRWVLILRGEVPKQL
jgi:hypothetical protein